MAIRIPADWLGTIVGDPGVLGLAVNSAYTVKKNGAVLFTVTTDANGILTFTDVAGVLAATDYTVYP